MKKWTVVGLFWLVQVFTDIIRVSLAVVAPTLMRQYDITPQVWAMSCRDGIGPMSDFSPLPGPLLIGSDPGSYWASAPPFGAWPHWLCRLQPACFLSFCCGPCSDSGTAFVFPPRHRPSLDGSIPISVPQPWDCVSPAAR